MIKRRGFRGLVRFLRGSIMIFLLTPVALALAANPNVETRISPAKIRAGERFSLHIVLHGPPGQATPDLTPLKDAFEILGIHQSQRQSYVNGAFDASSNWDITLLPKKTGRLEIPSLAIGSASTTSGSILVSSAGRAPAAMNRAANAVAWPKGAVAVQVSADKLDPYERERVVLRVRLYAGDDLIEGSLAEPHVEGATVERVGEDQAFEEEIKGNLYRGVERVYTVIPERAGELVVSPIAFDGLVRDSRTGQNRRRRRRGYARPSLFDDFFGGSLFDDDLLGRVFDQGRRRVVARSEPFALNVRPRPEASQGSWWLPARGLSLEEDWNPSPDRVRVGETLTRRITLRVEGASAIQLPPLSLPEVMGVKQYAEAPQISEIDNDTIRVQDATVIPTQPGTFELPAIEISWWDTQADVPRTASLPARTFEVLPAIGGDSGAKPAMTQSAPQSATAASNPTSGLEFEEQVNPQTGPATPWVGLAIGLGVLAAAGAALWAWGRGRRISSGAPGGTGLRARPALRGAERALRRACRQSRPGDAESALRDIVRIRDAQSRRPELGRWAKALGSEVFDAEIAKLLTVQYSSTDQPWQGEALWKAYRRAVKRKPMLSRIGADRGLPPLYPEVSSNGDAHGVI